MPPSISSEETPVQVPGRLTSSKKWLLQVALLFGLLGLGRWCRHVPVRALAARPPVPRWQYQAPPASQREPLAQPGGGPAVRNVAFTGPGL